MLRISDNISLDLLSILRDTLAQSYRADFCVGYFNLRGWGNLDALVECWAGDEGECACILVSMQQLPHDELSGALSPVGTKGIDQATVLRLKKKAAAEFRVQLTLGAPADTYGHRQLRHQVPHGRRERRGCGGGRERRVSQAVETAPVKPRLWDLAATKPACAGWASGRRRRDGSEGKDGGERAGVGGAGAARRSARDAAGVCRRRVAEY